MFQGVLEITRFALTFADLAVSDGAADLVVQGLADGEFTLMLADRIDQFTCNPTAQLLKANSQTECRRQTRNFIVTNTKNTVGKRAL